MRNEDPTPAIRSFTIDTQPPLVVDPMAVPSTGINPGQQVKFTVRATDDLSGISSVIINLSPIGGPLNQLMYDDGTNGDEKADDGTYTYVYTIPTSVLEGDKILIITAEDNAKNTSTAQVKLTIDTEPPDTIILSGPSGIINYNNPTFTWSGQDNVTPSDKLEFSYRLNNNPYSAWSAETTVTFSTLTDGSYIFEVKARDLTRNEDPTPAIRSFTIDTQPPVTTDPTATPSIEVTLGHQVKFTVKATDNSSEINFVVIDLSPIG
ncbi:TPA: hypothetical protein DCX16_05345, partial [bacterium]|nr:hypothetical protein [bacterium]